MTEAKTHTHVAINCTVNSTSTSITIRKTLYQKSPRAPTVAAINQSTVGPSVERTVSFAPLAHSPTRRDLPWTADTSSALPSVDHSHRTASSQRERGSPLSPRNTACPCESVVCKQDQFVKKRVDVHRSSSANHYIES